MRIYGPELAGYAGLCWRPETIPPEEASQILDKLNSFSSAEEIATLVTKSAGDKAFSVRLARRLLRKKAELGRFDSLEQVASVPRLGLKTFNAMVNALKSP